MKNEIDILKEKLPVLVDDCSIDSDYYSVRHQYLDLLPFTELAKTTYTLVRCITRVDNVSTGESFKTIVPILKVPCKTEHGFKINGTFYKALGLDKRATGWYITTQSINAQKQLILELVPESGIRITFLCKNNEICVSLGSQKKMDKKISLGVFLKAITGKSYTELAVSLGIRNRLISTSLASDYELSRDECIQLTIDCLVKDSSYLEGDYKFRELKRRIFSKQFLNIGDQSYKRVSRNISFRQRCLNMELARPVLDYESDTILSEEILENIDNSGIDTLYIRNANKVFELKKYEITQGVLTEEELLTVINMYAVSLDEYPTLDNRYEVYNRRVSSYDERILSYVRDALTKINDVVSSHFITYGAQASVCEITFPKFDLERVIDKFKSSSSESQTSETTNALSVIAKDYKVVTDYKNKSTEEMIRVKDSEHGIYDPYQQPESKKVGLVNHLTLTASKDEEGSYKGTFIEVDDGSIVSEEPVLLSPYEITNSYIAPWDQDITSEQVVCYYSGRLVTINRNQVQYQEYSCLNNVSLPTAEIPFPNFSNGKRLVMGGNQGKQAALTNKRERPLVTTGISGLYEFGLLRAKDILSSFYDSHGGVKAACSKDDFCNSSLHLLTTDLSTVGYRNLIFDAYVNDSTTPIPVKYTVPFCQRTTDDTMTSYIINGKDGFVYKGDDLVAYDSSFDVNKYDLDLHVNLGHLKYKDPKVFDTSLALGNNYLVAIKSVSTTTVDDAITISESLLGSGKLSNISLHIKRVKIQSFEDSIEEFGCIKSIPNFNSNGLPKVGTFLKPNSIIVSKFKKVRKIKEGSVEVFSTIDTSERLDAVTSGEVILSIKESDEEAVVLLASNDEIAVGDKLAGDHGNKGVVAAILPESQMPYTKEGVPIEICFDPQGLPSRMNISILLVAVLGYAMNKSGKRCVVTPQNPDSYQVVQDAIKEWDIHPEYLYDGRTCKEFDRPATVGFLYIKKLKHSAVSKSNSTGVNKKVNPTTLQVRKGKKVSGGQTIGEMELWAMQSSGVTKVIQEFFSMQSDDMSNTKRIAKYAETGDESVFHNLNNNNDSVLLSLTRVMGVDIINSDNNSYTTRIMRDKDIVALAKRPVENHIDSLQDPSIFGLVDDPDRLAKTRKQWGYLDLHCEIIHPTWIYKSIVCKLLIVTFVERDDDNQISFTVKNLNSKIVKELIKEGDAHLAFNQGKVYFTRKCTDTDFDWESGLDSVVKVFKQSTMETAKSHYTGLLSGLEDRGRGLEEIFELKQTIDSIDSFIAQGCDLKDFVIKHFPVIPRTFRMKIMGRNSDFDMHYLSIMSSADSCKATSGRAIDVYKKIVMFLGIDVNIESPKKIKTVLGYFTGKNLENSDGFIRDHTMSKVVMLSFRGPIIPAKAGTVSIREVGVPFIKAVHCLSVFIIPKISKIKEISSVLDGNKQIMEDIIGALQLKDYYKLGNLLGLEGTVRSKEILKEMISMTEEVCSSKVVCLGRQPTLHRFGFRAFKPVLVEGDAIRIHPAVCTAYNADFDGDQMYGVFNITESAGNEAYNSMSFSRDLINPKDESFVLEPTQNTILGIYLATMLKDNKLDLSEYDENDITYYRDISSLEHDVMFGITTMQSLVCYKHSNGRSYISTSGRILFNSLIPNCFTEEPFTNTLGVKAINAKNYCELRFDGLIKKKKDKGDRYRTIPISDVINYLLDAFNGVEICNYLDDITFFGATYCDCSCISLGLDDLVQHPEISKYVDRANKIVSKISKYSEIGLTSSEDRKDSSNRIYRYITEYIKNTLLNYYDRNNNLFIMIDSGARGNVSQLAQTCGIIGVVSKTNSESLETPVLSNYANGLSSADQMHIAYGTRVGISSVQNDTALAGTLTRQAVYTTNGLTIVEHDCGDQDAELMVEYSTDITNVTIDGVEVSVEDLFDLVVLPTDDNINKYTSISGDVINSDLLYFIRKNSINTIMTNKGEVLIKFKVDEMFGKLIVNRVGKDLDHLSHSNIVTKDTVDSIQLLNTKSVKVRTMLSCKSIGGVCAKCFGIRARTHKFPKVGEYIGVEAAQALGEPATQLNMNRINAGGLAGGNLASGVNAFKSYVGGSNPTRDKTTEAVVAASDGYVTITPSGKDKVIVRLGERRYKIDKSLLSVKDGEFVSSGDLLCSGIIDINDFQLSDSTATLRKRQLMLMHVFYDIFNANSLDVAVRNFECIVRVQLSIGRVVYSNDPKFKEGNSYFIQELPDNDDVSYICEVEKTQNVINMYGGFLANLSYQSFATMLAKVSVVPAYHRRTPRSLLASILVGEDLNSNKSKTLSTLDCKNLENVQASGEKSVDNFDIFEYLKDNHVNTSKVTNAFSNLDKLDIFSKPEVVKPVVALEDELLDDEDENITPNENTTPSYTSLEEMSNFKR